MVACVRAVLVPGVLALLPEYAGLEDPVPEVRSACLAAVSWLCRDVTVLAGAQGQRIASHLLAVTARTGDEPSYLVVGNGSAKRSESAPGFVDERAVPFDDDLGARLRAGALDGIDAALARELWADTEAIAGLGEVLPPGCAARIDYEGDPYGVRYWVARWQW